MYTGDYRALEREFVSRVRDLRRTDQLSPLVVIVTSRLLGFHLKRHVADAGVPHINVRFLTMEELADHVAGPVLRSAGRTRMPGFASARVMAEALRSVAKGKSDFYFSGIVERPGFHDAMLATIKDLEEAALSPADLKQATRIPAVKAAVHLKKLKDLTAVWEGYRCLLDELAWVDDHQVMRSASDHLGESSLVREASALLVYGFYDLNALQKRMLERCVEVNHTFAFMPFEDSRAFDFARPTLGWMETKGFRVRPLAAEETGESPVLVHLRRHLFEDGAAAPLPQDAVTFVSAPGEVREAREIARLIAGEVDKRDLRSHEVGILLRDPATYGALLRDMFGRLGMEPYVPEGRALSETVEGRSVLLLLEVLARNYARSGVMEFVTFAPLKPAGSPGKPGPPPPVHRWDAVSIAAGIVEGRGEWEERLKRLAGAWRGAGEPEAYGGNGSRAGGFDYRDIESLKRFMRILATLLDAVGSAGTWTAKSAALTKAMVRIVEEGPSTAEIIETITQLGEMDRLPSPPSRSDFMQAVGDCLDGESIRMGRFERQGPAVVSLTGARGIPFKTVIVPGMTEKIFPPVIRQDAILLDNERRAINAAAREAGPLHLRSLRRLDEERLLFRLAAGAAQRSLVLTFPRLTIGTARERLPSSFILATAEALTGKKAYFDTIETTAGFRRVPLAEIAVSDPGEAVDQVEFDLAMALGSIKGKQPGGILCLRRHSAFFAEGLRLEAARWGERRFTVYDGVLEGARSLDLLKRDYAIAESKVSPTRLEAYAACPFGYLNRYILQIEPLEEPEEARTISPLDKGALVHTILWKFFTTLKAKKGEPLKVRSEDRALLEKTTEQVFRQFEKTGVIGYPVMWDLEKQAILAWLDDLIEEETEQDDMQPAYFEVRYGMQPWTTEESEISTEDAVPLAFGRRRIRLRGKIDRIDLSGEGRRARVIDYKTGKPHAKQEDFQGGTTLQLPLYIIAARHILRSLHPGIEDVSAEYYHIAAGGKKRHIGFSGDRLEAKREELTGILDTIADGIAGGLFFPLPGDLCRWCGFKLACGSGRYRILERKLKDPRAEAFLRMRGEIATAPGGGESE